MYPYAKQLSKITLCKIVGGESVVEVTHED